MNLEIIPIEFELKALQIAAKSYTCARFKLVQKSFDRNILNIEFKAYYNQQSCSNRSKINPTDDSYKINSIDFDVWFDSEERLLISSFWRRSLLTLVHGGDNNFYWMNDDGKELPQPYPDGSKFENMALDLYPLMKHYFL
ncbi:hypothetical protein [Calothrix sp. CCY 0018]|uniref:hypothetical protein n=1 Tax=Calothrix sp. CCY 0018 TaxID=3103864 RepID=UPI0039C6B632